MTAWRTEIEELHAFFEDWIGGEIEATGERTGRASTVVFRCDEAAPRGLAWLHVHETWIEGAGPG